MNAKGRCKFMTILFPTQHPLSSINSRRLVLLLFLSPILHSGVSLRASRCLSFLSRQFLARHAPYATEPAVVGCETGIRVSGSLALPEGRLRHVRAALPISAANYSPRIGTGSRRTVRIHRRANLVVSRTINVFAPFRHIAAEVVESPSVRFFLADLVSLLIGITGEPGITTQLVSLLKFARVVRSDAARIFPLGFGWQAIAAGRIVTVPIHRFFVVA